MTITLKSGAVINETQMCHVLRISLIRHKEELDRLVSCGSFNEQIEEQIAYHSENILKLKNEIDKIESEEK